MSEEIYEKIYEWDVSLLHMNSACSYASNS